MYFRVGGAGVGKAATSLVVNSDDVIGDHLWIWRADHGSGVGWTSNTADTGLVVNGDDVTMYGLFVEHFQKDQTVWNGNGGRTYFFQNEMPYDPPNQAAWMNGSTRGYPAYKVAASVTSHQAYGLGSYRYFDVDPGVTAARAIEAPENPNVRFTSMVTVSPRRHRHHQPRRQRHRRPVERHHQRRRPRPLPLTEGDGRPHV